jgi:hypothetical protein
LSGCINGGFLRRAYLHGVVMDSAVKVISPNDLPFMLFTAENM